MSREIISVSGSLSLEEFKKAQIYHLKLLEIVTFFMTFTISVLVLLFIMRGFFKELLFLDLWFVEVLLASIISLTMATLIYFWLRLNIRIRASSEYKSNQQVRSEMVYTFSDEGVHQNKIKSTSYYDWDDILSIYEHQDMYLLYISKLNAIILPKRFFGTKCGTENKEEMFKRVICENITTQKIKWF